MFADAESYNRHHKASVKEANTLMDYVLNKMSFEEDDVIMDIGCASGDNTKDVLLARSPRLQKMVAIDIIPEMIEFASTHNEDERIEYHVADIEDKSTWKQWEGTISKIFSVFCFHFVKCQRETFQHLHDLLKPKGEAAFASILSCALWKCYPKLTADLKWNRFLKDADQKVPDSHHAHYGVEHYRQMLKDLGFEVLLCEEERKSYVYPNDMEMKAALKSYSALTSYIPEELREEFIRDLFEIFMTYTGRNSDGSILISVNVLTAHIKKP